MLICQKAVERVRNRSQYPDNPIKAPTEPDGQDKSNSQVDGSCSNSWGAVNVAQHEQ